MKRSTPQRLSTCIMDHNGAPALFVNGEPSNALMFWHSRIPDAKRDLAGFAARGVHLVSAGFSPGLTPEGGCDFTATDRTIAAILDANPEALILPRVNLVPLDWWLDRHPGERMVHLDPRSGRFATEGGGRVCFASRPWRTEMGQALHDFIVHCEREHQGHILGYHLGGGQFGEWSYSWDQVASDYGPVQQEAFREWLRSKYDGDVAALRAAWNDPAAAFGSASVPEDRFRKPGEPSLFDPKTHGRNADYLAFHSWLVSDAILHFARAAKQALAGVGSQKIVGVFYGYHFWDVDIPSNFHNSGHHCLRPVLASPDVDFLCAPHSYFERHAGGIFASQLPMASISLNGKLVYSEDDTRTFLSKVSDAYGRCTDPRSTRGVLRRNLIGVAGAGCAQWWMDLVGGGWYSDEGLLDVIGELKALADGLMERSRHPASQAAVVISPSSAAWLRQDANLTDALLGRQISEICHAGFPFDVYHIEDLALLFSRPWSEAYRLVVFLDAFFIDRRERDAIAARVARDGRTLLWFHAAGLVTREGLDPEAAREATGFSLHLGDPLYGGDAFPLTVETSLGGQRIAYGAGAEIGPVLFGDDPRADVWGWLIHPDRPGLLHRDFPSHRSVWSAAPGMPAVVLREIARRAGVHVYDDDGDQVLAAGDLLAVHATCAGQRRIRLPRPLTVRDAVSGEELARRSASVAITMERGDTAVLRLEG